MNVSCTRLVLFFDLPLLLFWWICWAIYVYKPFVWPVIRFCMILDEQDVYFGYGVTYYDICECRFGMPCKHSSMDKYF